MIMAEHLDTVSQSAQPLETNLSSPEKLVYGTGGFCPAKWKRQPSVP